MKAGSAARAATIAWLEKLDDHNVLSFSHLDKAGKETRYVVEVDGMERALTGREVRSYALGVCDARGVTPPDMPT